MHPNEIPIAPVRTAIAAPEAEQSVIGALLLDNGSLDRAEGLRAEHFYRAEHGTMFREIVRQIIAGGTCDVISLSDALREKVPDVLRYANSIAQSTPSAANIGRYADMVIDRAQKRMLYAVCSEVADQASAVHIDAATMLDQAASRIEALGRHNTRSEPVLIGETLGSYIDVLTARMNGDIKPIATGFEDLDKRLDGGLERGTLTVVAGRPAMGKSALGLCFSRNVAAWGSSLFLSMEMSETQVNDRNISALGKLPISWLRKPTENQSTDDARWAAITHACQAADSLNFHIDDQTGLNLLEIRAKARAVKRKAGLDLLVVDQLSFMTGAAAKDNKSYEIGEYTRGLLALGKELDIAVVLLAQLNRDCEKRPNKRPMMADLSVSGSIEQDAANVLLLYRDEVYNPDSPDKGVCEVNCVKQRQGEPGIVALTYVASQTRFEDLAFHWQPPSKRDEPRPGKRFA